MELMEYQRMYDLEEHHWWFQGRFDLMRRMVLKYCPQVGNARPRLLDMGCGTGLFAREQAASKTTVALDFSWEALRFARSRGVSNLICADSQELPFESNSFDIVTAFDLIEHVQGDRQLVCEAHRVLRPGGIALIAVPAHPFLLGSHDDALHHIRRYTWKNFEGLFDPAIWKKRRMTWTFASVYPPALIVRTLRKTLPERQNPTADTNLTPAWMNRTLLAWHRLENSWVETRNLPFGLSMLTVREKVAR
jgi:SAM-dependent methyltransferase